MTSLVVVMLAGAAASLALLALTATLMPRGFLAAGISHRSNHHQAARQIGGFAVVPALLAAVCIAGSTGLMEVSHAAGFVAAAILLFICGVLDDAHDLTPAIKSALQAGAAMIAIYGIGDAIVPEIAGLHPILTTIAVTIVLIWAINLTNFMDGIDLIVVAGVGVPAAVIGLGGLSGAIDLSPSTILATATAAALLPFAAANWPPARVFLGDNGSLPVGLAAGCIALGLGVDHPAAAGLLPFAYFIIDSGFTLVLRAISRKNIFAAHSEHAYQFAKRSGRSAFSISLLVALVSAMTSLLAVGAMSGQISPTIALVAGYAAAIALYVYLRRAGQTPADQTYG